MGSSGPSYSFCLAIQMWQSQRISMTILFLKKSYRAPHFYWWNSIRTWQKFLFNYTPPPPHTHTHAHTAPLLRQLTFQVSVSLLPTNMAALNIQISRNLFIPVPRDVLISATGVCVWVCVGGCVCSYISGERWDWHYHRAKLVLLIL